MIAPCTRCGAVLPADSPEQLCPRCLLQAALESGTATPARGESPPTAVYSSGFAAPTPEELQKLFPTLEILELLGKGGMGAVYKARQTALDRFVAVKILPPHIGQDATFSQRFTREAQSLAKLNHPSIVSVYDFGQTSGLFYFVMEYIDGVNIRQAMRAGTLSPAEALKIVPQVCDALQFAHDEGIVHRDIKPENILLDKKGRVKIADFGLAKLVGGGLDRVDAPALTGTQQVMGTLHYMAPEQIEGRKGVDHRADIYSLGVTFYEMLTGELPLGRFAPPSQKVQIDVRLDEVVLRTPEKEPDKRYQHVSEVKTEVESIGGMSSAAMRRLHGREYKSAATVFGVPLLHVAFGIDPKTGKLRKAIGIVAVGDVAFGALACGGLAMRGVTLGGICLGMISIGGLALGLLLAIGGMAVGGIAFGGLAIGGLAIGGVSVGWYAFGGTSWGRYVLSGAQRDPEAVAFVEDWAVGWPKWPTIIAVGGPVLSAILAGFVWLVFYISSSANRDSALARYFRWAGLPMIVSWLIALTRELLVPTFGDVVDGKAGRTVDVTNLLPAIVFGILIPVYCHYLWLIFGLRNTDDAAARARHAGNWMFGLGIAYLAYASLGPMIAGSYYTTLSSDTDRAIVFALGMGVLLFGAIGGVLFIRGGLKLSRLQDSAETRVAAVAAMLPLAFLWPFALPIGVLVLSVAGRDDVRTTLKRQMETDTPGAKRHGSSWFSRLLRVRAFWMALWSGACAFLFWLLGVPSFSPQPMAFNGWHGQIDRRYWPYDSSADITVSLTPTEKSISRLVISERRQVKQLGWQGIGTTWVTDGWRQPLTRDEIRLHVRIRGQEELSDERQDLTIDVLNGRTWSFVDKNGRIRKDTIPFDEQTVVLWLEALGLTREAASACAHGTAEIVLLAASSDSITAVWPSGARAPVGRLERAALRQEQQAQFAKDIHKFPFADHVGAERVTVEPLFNILWVSVPVALTVWLAGLWALRRVRYNSTNAA